MYARVVTGQCQSTEKLDEAFQMYRDSISPAYMQQPGFKGGLWLSERSTGKIMSITLWATETDVLTGESSGYFQAQIAKFAHVLASPVMREAFEVTLQV